MTVYDITRNACEGNWEMIYLDDIQADQGIMGDTTLGPVFYYMDNFLQTSRSKDGEKIFFSWVNGGKPPFSYAWVREVGTNSIPEGFTRKLNNVYAARYTCLIKQTGGCNLIVKSAPQGRWKPELVHGFAKPHINPQGPGGSIQAAFRKVKNPFDQSYSWNNGTQGALRTDLQPGVYGVSTTDSTWCSVSEAFTLPASFEPLQLTAEMVHDCKGRGVGEIRLHLPGGTYPHSLYWDHGPTSPTITGLSAGTYYVTVYDSLQSCAKRYTYHLRESLPLEADAVVTPIACKGGNDGRIDLTVCGGSGYPIVQWSTGDNSYHLQNLSLGSYQVHVTDEMGCYQDSLTVVMTEVTDSLTVAATTTPNISLAYRGQAFANASGGWPPYTYVWNSRPVQTQHTAKLLPRGSYQVVATDSRGCTATDSVFVDTYLGLEAPFAGDISVYPNPNKGDFWLDIESAFSQKIEIKVFDVQGKVVLKQALGHQVNLHHRIQLGEVAVGMYFLQVRVGETVWREKVLIEK